MKLSTAIRLGAMLKPQTFGGGLMAGDATCALGAALDAVGQLSSNFEYGRLIELWPIADVTVTYPCADDCCVYAAGDRRELRRVVWHLNDLHHWTREQIADWVETIEQQQAPGDALQALSLVGVGID